MQITTSGGKVRLQRYGGTTGKGDARTTHLMRIGSFSDRVQPEFQVSATDTDPEKIPFAIFRCTTPEEHDELLAYVQKLRVDEMPDKVRALAGDLRSVCRLLQNFPLDTDDAETLISACSSMMRALRRSKSVGAGTKKATITHDVTPPASISGSQAPERGAEPPTPI